MGNLGIVASSIKVYKQISISRFYLHDATSTDSGTLPTSQVSGVAVDSTATGANTNRIADAIIGLSQATSPAQNVGTNWGFARRFVSAPMAAQTISGNVTGSLAGLQALGGGAPAVGFYLAVWRPGTGAKVGDFVNQAGMTRYATGATGTTEQALATAAISLGSLAVLGGDILVIELYATSTSAGPLNVQTFYDGTTEGSASSNAAYISFSNAIAMA